MINYVLHRLLVKGNASTKDLYNILYMKDMRYAPLRRVRLCENQNIMFCPEQIYSLSRVGSLCLSTEYTSIVYKHVKRKVILSQDSGNVWTEEGSKKRISL